MSNYPVRKGGLIVPPGELGFSIPTPEQLGTRGLCSIHHGYYPVNRFNQTRYGSVFRNLITNTYPMLNTEHNQGQGTLHTRYREGVFKPNDGVMIEVVDEYLAENGVIRCRRENHTREVYEIQPKDWQHTRLAYKRRIK